MSSRPRRNTRNPGKYENVDEEEYASASRKRKTPQQLEPDAGTKVKSTAQGKPGSLEWYLGSEKSSLASVGLNVGKISAYSDVPLNCGQKVINGDTWFCLSSEDRQGLVKLLPVTAFPSHQAILPHYHPSVTATQEAGQDSNVGESMEIDVGDMETLPFLTSSALAAALTTFQDHLYSGWYSRKHHENVDVYQSGIRDNTIRAAWKDEAWEEGQVAERVESSARSRRTGQTLGKMLSRGVLSIGDILSYCRVFPQCGIKVEKDVLIEQVSSNLLTLVAPSGSEAQLPLGMIMRDPLPPTGASLQQLYVESPDELERVILDMDNRIPMAQRGGANSWKKLSLWKLKDHSVDFAAFDSFGFDDGTSLPQPRGPRENRGTLFYLRGAFSP